ncbi:3'-5' exonuclease [Escherichia coli]
MSRWLTQVVTRFTLRDMMERGESEEELDQVQLMTLHASKGLEFPLMSTWSVWKKGFCPRRAASMKIISMRSGGWPMSALPAPRRN